MTLNRTVLKKGDLVRIKLEKGDNAVTPGMLEYDGLIAEVTRVGGRYYQNGTLRALHYIYELEGVVSPYGIPYSFLREMLEKVPDEEVPQRYGGYITTDDMLDIF